MYSLSCLPSSIFVGRQSENNFKNIEFDVSDWVNKYPQAYIYIAAYRPDGYVYLPEVARYGEKLIWNVSNVDTAAPGTGEIELRVGAPELLGKSQKITTFVATSITGTVPAPPPDWTEEAAALDARVTYLEQHGTGGGFDIHSLQNEDNIADADETPFYDASADAQRKTTWANVKAKLKAYFDTLYLGASALAGYATEAWVQASYRTAAAQNAIDAQKAAASDVEAIEALIPTAATASNQLADKAFVNSTVGTNTAIFRGTFNSLAELQAYAGEKTNNDYAFVVGTDTSGNTVYNRYKYNGSSWVFEYALNNSSFTAAQWAAIESNITAALVASYNAHIADDDIHVTAADKTAWNGKLSDAPSDGKQYARKNGAWSEVQGGGGGDNTLVVTVWLSDYGTPAIIGTPSTTHAEIIDAIENGKDITLAAQIDDSSARYNFDIARSDGDYWPVVFAGLIPSNDEYWGEHTTVYISVSPSDVWSISYDDYALKSDLDDKLSDAPSDGKQYARQDGAWTEVESGGGGGFYAGDEEPDNTNVLWIDTDDDSGNDGSDSYDMVIRLNGTGEFTPNAYTATILQGTPDALWDKASSGSYSDVPKILLLINSYYADTLIKTKRVIYPDVWHSANGVNVFQGSLIPDPVNQSSKLSLYYSFGALVVTKNL